MDRSRDNRLWGGERIRGEFLKLGVWVSMSKGPSSSTCAGADRARLARQAHALHALHAALGHPPSPADLAAATGLPRARVDALTAPLPAPVPLDLTVGDAETMTVGDLLSDPTAPPARRRRRDAGTRRCRARRPRRPRPA